MDQQSLASRITNISTLWTEILCAHGADVDARANAQRKLIERYQAAIYRYLLGEVRDPDAADELFQEFALDFVRGALRHADPTHGRFRDYLKAVLIHLVARHRKRQRPGARSLEEVGAREPAAPIAGPDICDEEFVTEWRAEVLARTWSALAEEQARGGQPFHSVLRFRSQHPGITSAEMAEQLTIELRPAVPFTETGIRKTLERARAKFADLLLDEVAHSLDDPTLDQVEQELIDLHLLAYCRPALQRRRESSSSPH